MAGLRIVVQFSGGTKDTTDFQVPIGLRTSADPTGPDRYGYVAYENGDTSYPEAPNFSWIEIDPALGGDGTEVILGDYGDYQDKSSVVDIPFPFVYYGQSYTRATICSNGWVAMCGQWNTEYRNWTIPGAGGPEAMIAPFWDDLYQQSGTSKVFRKYDAANHWWVVEWSRMRNIVSGQTETFEVILKDPAFHTTETGDGEIVFQYSAVSNIDSTDGYATVGIENQMQDDGVLITFFNQYTPGSTTLVVNRAIRFVPKREVLAGLLNGSVTNQSAGGTPINGAIVTVVESGNAYTTAPNGHYEGSELAGTYTLIASHPSFAPDTTSAVEIQPGSNVVVDFSLRDIAGPSITHQKYVTTSDSIGPYKIEATIVDYSPISGARLYYRLDGGGFTNVAMSSQGIGRYFADIPGQPWTTMVEYYIEATDIASNTSTDPPDAPAETYVFYVGPTIAVFHDNLEFDRDWTAGAQGDNATNGLWVRVNPNATYHSGTMVQPEDDHTPDGVNCWVTGNAPPGAGEAEADVDGGVTSLTTPRIALSVAGIAVLRYYRWYSNDTSGFDSDPFTAQISDDDGATWVTLETVTTSDRSWHLSEFDLGDYIDFTDQVRVRFTAADLGGGSIVEAAIDDVEISATGMFGAGADEIEKRTFALDQNRPNPFNPVTKISFSLAAGSPASLVVYDVQGRAVRRLVVGPLAAGSHVVVWDGRDDAGRAVPSGIYLYRLETGEKNTTRKMILLQ